MSKSLPFTSTELLEASGSIRGGRTKEASNASWDIRSNCPVLTGEAKQLPWEGRVVPGWDIRKRVSKFAFELTWKDSQNSRSQQ